MTTLSLRSPCLKTGGLVYFARMLDKIRAQAKGELPEEYLANLGRGFDANCVHFLRVNYDQLVDWVKEGGSDEEILHWCFNTGTRPSDDEIYVWNEFMGNGAERRNFRDTQAPRKKNREWRTAPRSRPCSPSSTPTKAAAFAASWDHREWSVIAGVLCVGGGGGCMRQSINFQTALTSRIVKTVAIQKRTRCNPAHLAHVAGCFQLVTYHSSLGEGVDPLRQREIEFGEATFTVGGENQAHLVVANVDVRMMFFVLCHLGNGVYEIDRIGEVVELEGAFNVFFLQLPFRNLFHSLLKLACFDQVSHNGTTTITRKLFCNVKSSTLLWSQP